MTLINAGISCTCDPCVVTTGAYVREACRALAGIMHEVAWALAHRRDVEIALFDDISNHVTPCGACGCILVTNKRNDLVCANCNPGDLT